MDSNNWYDDNPGTSRAPFPVGVADLDYVPTPLRKLRVPKDRLTWAWERWLQKWQSRVIFHTVKYGKTSFESLAAELRPMRVVRPPPLREDGFCEISKGFDFRRRKHE